MEERKGTVIPGRMTTMPSTSNIKFPVLMHVEPFKGGNWETEMTAPMCEVAVDLTPDRVAYQHFGLPVPPRSLLWGRLIRALKAA